MEKIKFTPDQSLAINTEGCDILVSAAAGSGKTAVLTRRVLNKIIDPSKKSDITDFLIVTFTISAAGDLKRKLSEGIREEMKREGADTARLRRQLLSLSYAKIATIDSFCHFIVKDCAATLSLPVGITLGDEDEMEALANEIMNETVEAFYAESDANSDFLLLAEAFSDARGDAKLIPVLFKIYKNLINYPCPMTLLSENVRELEKILEFRGKSSVFSSPALSPIMKDIKENLIQACGLYREALKVCELDEEAWEKYMPVIEHDVEWAETLKSSADVSYEAFYKALVLDDPDRMPTIRGRKGDEVLERIKELRIMGRDIIASLKKEWGAESEEEIFSQIETHTKILKVINEVITVFHSRFMEEKKKRKIMSFSDMNHYAFDSLIVEGSYDRKKGTFKKTPYAESLTRRFSEILIDEYQDVNELQDLIFRAVSNSKNRFMVGDIKQSIYAFRGATPEIFEHYRDTFAPHTDPSDTSSTPKTVFLQNNYRSDRAIIDFTNDIFSRLMNCESKKYLEKDRLVLSKSETLDYPVELTLLEKGREQDEEDCPEAQYVADTIISLVNSGEWSFGDVAILARSHARLEKIKAALDKKNIPCDSTGENNFFSSYEILSLVSLLKAVANPTNDVSLVSAMTTLPFSFSPDELLKIRSFSKKSDFYFALLAAGNEEDELGKKCREFLLFIDKMRDFSSENSCDRTLWKIMEETNFFSEIKKLSDPTLRRDNLISLYDLSRSFCRGEAKSLGALCDYFESLEKSGKKSGKKQLPAAVRLMTFHASKGLQFPVVFVVGLGGEINKQDSYDKIVFSPLGPTFDLPFSEPCTHVKSYLKKSAASIIRKNLIEEELRNLYVTFTRAERRLYITAETNIKSLKNSVFAASTGNDSFAYTVKNAPTCISLVAAALHDNQTFSKALFSDSDFARECSDTLCTNLVRADFESREEIRDSAEQKEFSVEFTEEALLFSLEKLHRSRVGDIPFKISVSEIKEGLLDEGEDKKEVEFISAPQFISPAKTPSPAFAGTSMHTFMQFCSFENRSEEDVRRDAQRLVRDGFILPEHEECLDYKKLARFFESKLFKMIAESPRVEREKRYTLMTHAEKLMRDSDAAEGDKVLIQGVVDCFFETPDKSLVLVDFKTDRVREENGREVLLERHSKQLKLYAEALSEMLSRRVDKIYIYSFALDTEIEVI